MKWDYSIWLYLERHCTARGLQPRTIAAYRDVLKQYRVYMQERMKKVSPEKVSTTDVLEYVEYLRTERGNKDSARNRTITILRSYYKSLVSMDYLDPRNNPMKGFPKVKAPRQRFREVLDSKEVEQLVTTPRSDTVMGIRDHTLLMVLCSTGIRASECSGLREKDVRLDERIIRVIGKGGDERTIPLDNITAAALKAYRHARGQAGKESAFFKSRKKGNGLSRSAIYERVRTYGRRARIKKKVSPHILRHTFATQKIRDNVNLVVLRDLLGHRQLSSTQVYLHMTGADIRKAMKKHPLRKIAARLRKYLPKVKLPYQYPAGTRFAFESP
jgi:site-specific recombinase XerD